MSRYYIYDTYTDQVAEFATRYAKEQRKKGLPAQGRDAREVVAQNDYKRNKNKPKRAPLDQRLNRMRQNNMVNNANRNPLGAASPVGAVKSGLIGNPAQRTLRNNLLGTSVAGRGLRAAGVLGTVGAVGLGGMALKRRADRKAAERNSIKGRVKSLLGR